MSIKASWRWSRLLVVLTVIVGMAADTVSASLALARPKTASAQEPPPPEETKLPLHERSPIHGPGGAMAVDTQRIHQASLLPSLPYRIFYEDFESWPPAGWTIVNNGRDCVWESTATINRPNFTGGDGDAASADSDRCGTQTTLMDTELRTPPINLLGVSRAWLIFKSDFHDYLNQDHGYVDISTDGGTTWTTLLHYDRRDYRTRIEIIDLTPHVGSANTIIRFRYVAPGWDWWWQVDEVEIYVSYGTFLPLVTRNYRP